MENAKKVLSGITYCRDAYETADKSDALMILTEWKQFRELDLAEIKKRMKTPVIIDGRNVYEPDAVKKLGFTYVSVGR